MSRIAAAFNPGITQPQYFIRQGLLQQIRALAPRLSGRLMDFGCGAKPYQSLFSVAAYIGVDYENPGHPHLNEQIDVFYDGKTIPFENDHFDSVFCSEVFEHVFNLPDILKELNRVLKPGGLMLITCPFAYCEHEVPHDFARYSSFGIRHLLQEHGFEIVEQHKTGNSVQTIHQLLQIYLHQHVVAKFKNIPVLRSVLRFGIYTSLNISGAFWSWLLPAGNDLYLNNVVLCKKAGV